MRKIGLCVVMIFLFLCLVPACAAREEFVLTDEPITGYIHAEGKDLVLEGKNIVLKGVNAGGWLLTEDWMSPTSMTDRMDSENGQYELTAALTETMGKEKASEVFDALRDNWWVESDFEKIAAIGFNMIRLPFGWKDLTDEKGNFSEKSFDRLDWFVENCEKNGLFVVLDLHGAYGSQNGKHHSGDTTTGGDLFGNEENERLTVQLWRAVAAHYADNRWVAGYDLLNEPEGTPGGLTTSLQWDFYDRLYREIRAIDGNHLIFMEACWEVEQMPDPKRYGWENVAYEYHYYNWGGGNDLTSTKKFLREKSKMEFRYNTLDYKVPVFIGEFTFFDNLDCWKYGLDFFKNHNMSWAIWTYKGCVSSNWALYNGYERTADSVVTPSTDYETALRIFSNTATDSAFRPNEELIRFLTEYLQ